MELPPNLCFAAYGGVAVLSSTGAVWAVDGAGNSAQLARPGHSDAIAVAAGADQVAVVGISGLIRVINTRTGKPTTCSVSALRPQESSDRMIPHVTWVDATRLVVIGPTTAEVVHTVTGAMENKIGLFRPNITRWIAPFQQSTGTVIACEDDNGLVVVDVNRGTRTPVPLEETGVGRPLYFGSSGNDNSAWIVASSVDEASYLLVNVSADGSVRDVVNKNGINGHFCVDSAGHTVTLTSSGKKWAVETSSDDNADDDGDSDNGGEQSSGDDDDDNGDDDGDGDRVAIRYITPPDPNTLPVRVNNAIFAVPSTRTVNTVWVLNSHLFTPVLHARQPAIVSVHQPDAV